MVSALTPEGAVPEDVVRLISDSYKALPHPSVRWRTIAGRDFQNLLERLEYTYGRPAVAAVAPLTRQGIRAIVDRPPVRDIDVVPYPNAQEIQALTRAWQAIVAANSQGRSVRAGSREFTTMQRALVPLTARYDLPIIALAARAPISRLRKFVP